MIILALETTCDETAAAVIAEPRQVLSSVVASQDKLHQRFHGVVPELASRAHVECILAVVDEAISRAAVTLDQLDAIAVATTPGLAGSLLVGLSAAKALCAATGKPLVKVDHVQAHIYACQLAAAESIFPCVGLVVSGGHSNLFKCLSPVEFELLGSTIDDAAGEAFDKVASLLGLPYPGGPAIEKAAASGDRRAFHFPRAMVADRGRLAFSFSGLKTAVRYKIAPPGKSSHDNAAPELSGQMKADLAASFQEAVVDCLVDKSMLALEMTGLNTLAVGGGVAANRRLRDQLEAACHKAGIQLRIAPPNLRTDNAIMGAIALERLRAGLVEPLTLDIKPGLLRSG